MIDADAEIADDAHARQSVEHGGIDGGMAVGVDRVDRPLPVVPRHEFDAAAEQFVNDRRHRQIGKDTGERHESLVEREQLLDLFWRHAAAVLADLERFRVLHRLPLFGAVPLDEGSRGTDRRRRRRALDQ